MTNNDIERLENILYRETSVIASEDVPLLMEVIRNELENNNVII